jgi:two-component system response regulator AgrA
MHSIYLLEDDPIHLQFLSHEVQNTIMIEALPYEIRMATDDPQAIINDVANFSKQRCLFLLDIELNHAKMDGVQLATFVRANTSNADIIFITSHPESALLIVTNKIMPMDLIQKDLPIAELRTKLHQDLLDVTGLTEHTGQQLLFTVASTVHSVSLSQVNCLTVSPDDSGIVELFCNNQTASFRGHLAEFEKQYPTLFRCHKSYLVNLDNVAIFDTKHRILSFEDGSHAEVSFRRVAAVRKALETRHL